jgi:hypothetical protein
VTTANPISFSIYSALRIGAGERRSAGAGGELTGEKPFSEQVTWQTSELVFTVRFL